MYLERQYGVRSLTFEFDEVLFLFQILFNQPVTTFPARNYQYHNEDLPAFTVDTDTLITGEVFVHGGSSYWYLFNKIKKR